MDYKFSSELKSIFEIAQTPPPVQAMMLNLLATCVPLCFGLYLGELIPAIIAGLLGHFLFLTNAPAPLGQRIKNTIKNSAFFLTCMVAGIYLRESPVFFVLAFCLGVYALGISINISSRAEFVALLGLVNLILGYYSTFIDSQMLGQVMSYSFLTLLFILFLFGAFHLLYDASLSFERSPKPSLRSTLREFHIYSLSFSLVALVGFWACEKGISEKPYWVLITFIVIYKPEIRISFHKMAQRLLGTLVGVALTSLFFHYVDNRELHIAFIAVSSLLLPYWVAKNYWLGTILITTMVVALLSLPTQGVDGEALAMVRMWATVMGVILALVGVVLYRFMHQLRPV